MRTKAILRSKELTCSNLGLKDRARPVDKCAWLSVCSLTYFTLRRVHFYFTIGKRLIKLVRNKTDQQKHSDRRIDRTGNYEP